MLALPVSTELVALIEEHSSLGFDVALPTGLPPSKPLSAFPKEPR
jgi:hypothetical protein